MNKPQSPDRSVQKEVSEVVSYEGYYSMGERLPDGEFYAVDTSRACFDAIWSTHIHPEDSLKCIGLAVSHKEAGFILELVNSKKLEHYSGVAAAAQRLNEVNEAAILNFLISDSDSRYCIRWQNIELQHIIEVRSYEFNPEIYRRLLHLTASPSIQAKSAELLAKWQALPIFDPRHPSGRDEIIKVSKNE